MKLVCALAWLCAFAGPARAEVMRLHWRGVQSTGTPPARLDRAVEGHLAIALKQLGTELAAAPPVDAEASARCTFGGKSASCLVEVVRPADGVHVERKQEIPFRDADDLAETLSLLVAEMVQTDLREIVTPREEIRPPPPPPPPQLKSQKHANANANGNANGNGNANVNANANANGSTNGNAGAIRRRAPVSSHGIIEVGPTVAVGFVGEPVLAGAVARGSWAHGLLRAGGTLSITGIDADRGGFSLTFLRLVTGPRLGLGFDRRRVEGELTAGPGLFVLSTDAHGAGKHTLTTFAGLIGARLGVRLAPAFELGVAVDVAVAAHREQVTSGATTITEFGLGSLEVALTLAYRL